MLLTEHELDTIFQEFIKTRVLPYGANPHPIFLTQKGGNALTKRLRLVLRGYPTCLRGNRIDIPLVISLVRKSVENGVYIVGLDYTVKPDDLEELLNIYHKFFN